MKPEGPRVTSGSHPNAGWSSSEQRGPDPVREGPDPFRDLKDLFTAEPSPSDRHDAIFSSFGFVGSHPICSSRIFCPSALQHV